MIPGISLVASFVSFVASSNFVAVVASAAVVALATAVEQPKSLLSPCCFRCCCLLCTAYDVLLP